MKEEWKRIKGFDNYYISNLGNVKNNTGDLIALELSSPGYYRVHLSKLGKAKHYSVHRLVAESFLVKPRGCNVVNHKDGCKTNNTLTNLEWCTHSTNLRHAYDSGLRIGNFGRKNGQAKLSENDVIEIRKRYVKRSKTHNANTLSKQFNVSPRLILAIVNGERWSWLKEELFREDKK